MIYYIYILLCDDKTFYTGVTSNINKRINEHLNKRVFYTKKFSKVKIVYKEEFSSLFESRKREKQIKGWSVAKKKALIGGNKKLLVELSKST